MNTFAVARVRTTMALIGGLGACGSGGGGGSGGASAAIVGRPGVHSLQTEVDRLFPYVADQPFDVTLVCTRSNSSLTYYFDFDLNLRFTAYFESNTFQQFSFSGSYTHANGEMRMVADPNQALMLDETTTRIVPHLGLLAEFHTPIMRCGAAGHGCNNPVTETFKSYDCPNISLQATGIVNT